MVMNLRINGNESKSKSIERLHLCTASLLLFSSLLQNLNSTELDRIGLNQIEPETKPNQIELDRVDETCILATLSIPANLWSSWSTLQPSLVNLSSTLQDALLDNPWWTLLNNPWWQPGNPSWLLNCGKPVQEK